MPTFEWDEEKASSNLRKHGVPFDRGIALWLDEAAVVANVSRAGDGEPRFKRIGQVEGVLYVVVFTRRGETIRLISVRRTNASEVRVWNERMEKDGS